MKKNALWIAVVILIALLLITYILTHSSRPIIYPVFTVNGYILIRNYCDAVPNGYVFLDYMTFNTTRMEYSTDAGSLYVTNDKRWATNSDFNQYGIVMGRQTLHGKCMFSLLVSHVQNQIGGNVVGIATSTFHPLVARFGLNVGEGKDSIGIYENGTIKCNGINVSTGPLFNDTNQVDVAIDNNRQLMWYRVDRGAWNGDPETGTGGVSYAQLKN